MADTPPPRLDSGAALRWATSSFRANTAVFMGLAAVVAVIQIVPLFAAAPVGRFLADCSDIGTTEEAVRCLRSSGTYLVALGVLTVIVMVVAFVAQYGVQRAALARSDGEQISFGATLQNSTHFGAYVRVALVVGLLAGVGFALCIVPGFVVLLALQLAPYFVLDRGLKARSACRASLSFARQQFPAALLVVAANALVWLPWALCGWLFVLTIFTLPIATLFTAHMYRQFNGEPVR